MRNLRCVPALVLGVAVFGQPPNDDSLARKSGLSVRDIKVLRMNLGISESDSHQRIVAVDADSLKSNGHILVVEVMFPGACIQLHVVERLKLTEVWTLSKVPTRSWLLDEDDSDAKKGICPQASMLPRAFGTSDHRIVLELPVRSDPFQRSIPSYTHCPQPAL